MAITKISRRQRIKYRIRKKISGTSAVPRLVVFRSNRQIYVQLVDDDKRVTILSASSAEKDFEKNVPGRITKIQQAEWVGKLISGKALAGGIKQVVFDRNGYLYHGRVKALAEAARKGGLKF